MATSPRIKNKITNIQAELVYIDAWLKNNPTGVSNYSFGTRSLGYIDPIRALQLRNELQEELDTLLYPGGRFKRVMPVRGI